MDTIRVRGAYRRQGLVNQAAYEHLDRLTGELTRTTCSGHEFFPDLGVRVGAGDRWGPHAWFEFSAPKFYRQTNTQPEPVEGVHQAVRTIWEVTSEVVEWAVPPEDLQVTRVDWVHDITGVKDIAHVLRALRRIPHVGGTTRRNYSNPSTGTPQSETVGTPRRWQVTVYDKGQELLTASRHLRSHQARALAMTEAHRVRAQGQLRTEVSLRGPRLRERLGSTRLGDVLDADRLDDLARRHWEMSRLGTPINGSARLDEVLDDLYRTEPTGSKTLAGLARMLGTLLLDAKGLDQGGHPETISKYRKMAEDLGLDPTDLLPHDGPPVRLDWDHGLVTDTEAAA